MSIDFELIEAFLFSVIRVSTPIMIGAMAAVVTKKAGLLNMAMESMMLSSALTGVIVSGYSQNLPLGVICALIASVGITMIICYCAFILKCDLYLTSIAMNMALVGGTVFVMFLTTGQKLNTAASLNSKWIGNWDIPLIKEIPFLGKVLSGHNVLTYVGFLLVFLVWVLIYKTKIGLRIRAVGENPQAAESVGVSMTKIYFLSFGISGLLAGLSGVYMSMGYIRWFARDMIAGRGFISMSAMNVANGEPLKAAIAALLFGISDAASNYTQGTSIPSEVVYMFPYVSTILLLIAIAIVNKARLRTRRKLLAGARSEDED